MSRRKKDNLDKWIDENTTEAQQIQKLKVRLKDLKADKDAAVKRANDLEEKLEFALSVQKPKKPAKIRPRKGRKKPAGCPGFLVSDTHFGEVVFKKRVNGLNEYNKDIAYDRMTRLSRKIAWHINEWSRSWDVDSAFIWLGGDIHTGSIHKELAETNDMGPTEAFLFAMRVFIQMLDHVLAETEISMLHVPCVGGNHDRLTDKLTIKNQKDYNLAWLLYNILEQHYEDEERIRFYIPDGTILYPFPVFDWVFRFIHGYQINYRDGVGGLGIPYNKKVQKWERAQGADYTCAGHHHTYYVFPDGVMNASLKGYDEYAYDNALQYGKPCQAAMLISEDHGMIMNTPIMVSK